MNTLEEVLDKVAEAPRGPSTVAVFDYDGTLIAGFSASAFLKERLRRGKMTPGEIAEIAAVARAGIDDVASFEAFLGKSLGRMGGEDVAALHTLGKSLFKHEIAAKLRREAFEILEAHRRAGHTLVLASSALPFQTGPAAEALEFDHVIDTDVEEDAHGRLTGRIVGHAAWGEEKARRAVEVIELYGDTAAAFAYSNGGEDVPLLRAVGNATAIAPDVALRREAFRHGWPVVECADPAPRPSWRDAARTVGFYGAFAAAFGVAGGIGLLRHSREAFLDIAFGVGSDLSLAVAGVDVRVIRGSEHLWAHRPCVFVFNHTSKIDTIVVAKLLRQGFTGVAKAEAKNVPMFGQLFQLAGVALIDRSDVASARATMEPLLERMRSGTSVAISPEGTRTPTPRMAPFKKGPFHLAMQAGVPVVPIVFRGIDQVQWRGAQAVRPGIVEAVVLPPFDTSEWRAETVTQHRDAVREAMLAAQADWPAAVPLELNPSSR